VVPESLHVGRETNRLGEANGYIFATSCFEYTKKMDIITIHTRANKCYIGIKAPVLAVP
jgi:hypothetical protein